jgi:hydroxylamine reductase (hybrid-cluster protein)
MERIHKKSALPDASGLLAAAHERGAELLWERYEQQLPLCAFTSNGLNCRKCFQGPCRINPFGDEPSRGVCGADRDQIVMENLFQATLEGVMESARAVRLLGIGGADEELPDIARGLPSETTERLSKAGVFPVRNADLFRVQNGFFSHKGYLSQTLRDLTRLGLINYGFLSQVASSLGRTGERPDFHPEGINLFVAGQAPTGLIQAIQQQAVQRAEGKRVNLFAQGAHRSSLTMAVADHGSPELALGMNVDALIVAPNASWPGIEALAAKYGIPVILVDGGKSSSQTASEAVDQALRHSQTAFYGTSARTIQPGNADGASALPREQALKQALHAGRITGVAVLFGEANAKQTFFERTLALMEAAVAEKALVLLGGDLGSQVDALVAELGKRPGAQLTAFAAELAADGLRPIASFGSAFEFPAVVSLLNALTAAPGARALPVVVAFPEFFRAATWASAVSLLSLGFTVQIGIRLPFWGSPWLAELMKTEWQKITGGTLLATPALPEARAQAEELAACLKAGRAR